MRASNRIGRFLLVCASVAACGEGASTGNSPSDTAPQIPAVAGAEEPARPAPDARKVVREPDDETEGLDLQPWEGSGPPLEDAAAGGTIGGSFTLARPFPPRSAGHRDLLLGRGRSTQTAVDEALAALRAGALPGGGWAGTGDEPDLELTSLGVLAEFSLGDAWTDRRRPPATRAACKWLSRRWTARARGEVPSDTESNTPRSLRTSAILVLALSEWRAWTWVVYAESEAKLSLRTLETLTRQQFPDGASVASEDAAIDAAWTLLALHVARLAELDVDPAAAARVRAALDRGTAGPSDPRTTAGTAVARALGIAVHGTGAHRADVVAALQPALATSSSESSAFSRPSDLTFLASIAAMQVGGDTARDWNRRVLRPLAAAPRAPDVRGLALTAMCLSAYFRYAPAVGE